MSRLMSIIHIAKSQLGMDDETYRTFLQNVTGKSSCAKMTTMELWEVAEALKAAGFVKVASRKKQAGPADPQHSKIRALWLSMADAGIVRNRSEKALNQYVKRITGYELPQCTVKQCQAVIETLKKWIERVEDDQVREQLLAILAGSAASPVKVGESIVAEAYCERFQ